MCVLRRTCMPCRHWDASRLLLSLSLCRSERRSILRFDLSRSLALPNFLLSRSRGRRECREEIVTQPLWQDALRHPPFSLSAVRARAHWRSVACCAPYERANSKYKHVICRSKGACVTEHLPRARGPRSVPQRAPTEEEGLLRQRKGMTYRQLPRAVT